MSHSKLAQDLQTLLSHVNYKPGTSFKVLETQTFMMDQPMSETVMVEMTRVVPDRETLQPTQIKSRRAFHYPEIESSDQFLNFMRHWFMELEAHEVDEFFRFKSKIVNDPHS